MAAPDPFLFTRIAQRVLDHLATQDPDPASDAPRGRVLLVTSTRPGEGRSFVSRGLAQALAAREAGDVAWVDAAFDRPAREGDGSRQGAAGLSELMTLGALHGLVPPEEGAARPWTLGRGVLASATLMQRPDAVARGMLALRAGFTLSVLDAPCLSRCGALLHDVDAVVMVVDPRGTPRREAQDALEAARLAPGRLAGVVLNRRPGALRRWLEACYPITR